MRSPDRGSSIAGRISEVPSWIEWKNATLVDALREPQSGTVDRALPKWLAAGP